MEQPPFDGNCGNWMYQSAMTLAESLQKLAESQTSGASIAEVEVGVARARRECEWAYSCSRGDFVTHFQELSSRSTEEVQLVAKRYERFLTKLPTGSEPEYTRARDYFEDALAEAEAILTVRNPAGPPPPPKPHERLAQYEASMELEVLLEQQRDNLKQKYPQKAKEIDAKYRRILDEIRADG